MTWRGETWEWYSRHTSRADAGIAAVLLAFVLVAPPPEGGRSALTTSAPVIALVVLACGAVALRNRWPLPTFVIAAVAVAVVTSCTTSDSPAIAVVLLALYTVALRSDRRVSQLCWAATTISLLVSLVFAQRNGSVALDVVCIVTWAGLATAIGDGVRSRRAYLASVEERAARAEQSLHEEARRQVAEERLRIARELHDVVAHHMAVITVQAGVAGHLLTSDTHSAAESLGHIKHAGRTVLDELSGIMTVLRDPDEARSAAPSPGLDQLDDLLVSFRAAGLAFMLTRHGQPRTLGPAVDLVAFRVLQEALTNAHKHGTGSAQATITYSDAALSLCVTNPTRHAINTWGGHGLIGMQERAVAVGGDLDIKADGNGTFSIHAVLPIGGLRS